MPSGCLPSFGLIIQDKTMQPVTAEQVQEAAIAAGAGGVVTYGHCEVCELANLLMFSEGQLYQASNCTCVDSQFVQAPWQVAADWINTQPEESKIEVMRQFGFDADQEPETMPPSGGVKIPFEYERFDDWTERAKVFGGWLVKTTESVYHTNIDGAGGSGDSWDWRVATAFVPDPEWKWKI